jgi:hypothetical protein
MAKVNINTVCKWHCKMRYLTADRWRTTRSSQSSITQALADDGQWN